MNAVCHAQHMKPIAFGFDSVDVGEAVFADVLVLRLQSVTSAQKTEDLPFVLSLGILCFVDWERDFQVPSTQHRLQSRT